MSKENKLSSKRRYPHLYISLHLLIDFDPPAAHFAAFSSTVGHSSSFFFALKPYSPASISSNVHFVYLCQVLTHVRQKSRYGGGVGAVGMRTRMFLVQDEDRGVRGEDVYSEF